MAPSFTWSHVFISVPIAFVACISLKSIIWFKFITHWWRRWWEVEWWSCAISFRSIAQLMTRWDRAVVPTIPITSLLVTFTFIFSSFTVIFIMFRFLRWTCLIHCINSIAGITFAFAFPSRCLFLSVISVLLFFAPFPFQATARRTLFCRSWIWCWWRWWCRCWCCGGWSFHWSIGGRFCFCLGNYFKIIPLATAIIHSPTKCLPVPFAFVIDVSCAFSSVLSYICWKSASCFISIALLFSWPM